MEKHEPSITPGRQPAGGTVIPFCPILLSVAGTGEKGDGRRGLAFSLWRGSGTDVTKVEQSSGGSLLKADLYLLIATHMAKRGDEYEVINQSIRLIIDWHTVYF